MSNRIRIYMTGVGGQGTLTATTLLARVAVAQGVEVVAGEIHGMAQRGGVVESTILLGGWKSPKLGFGEADIVLGFEPLETLRGLRYLKQGGVVFSSTDVIPPLSVSAGREVAPGLDAVEQAVRDRASSAWFLPCRSMGIELGSAQCGNNILLALKALADQRGILLEAPLFAVFGSVKIMAGEMLTRQNFECLAAFHAGNRLFFEGCVGFRLWAC